MNEQLRSSGRRLRSWMATFSVIIAVAVPTAVFGGGAAGAESADDPPLAASTRLRTGCTIDDDDTNQHDPEGDDISYTGSSTKVASSAASQSLGADSRAEFTPGGSFSGEDCDAEAGFTNEFVVEPGSTGLAAGAPVTLQLTVRLDGMSDGWGSGEDGWHTHTDLFVSYELADTRPTPCEGEGCFTASRGTTTAELASAGFSAEVELERFGTAGNSFDPDGSLDETYEYFWSIDSNRAGEYTEGSLSDYTLWCDTYPCTPGFCFPGPHACGRPGAYSFDTGTQTVLFDTEVGARIGIEADIDDFTQAYQGPSFGSADFFSSFTSAITPASGFEGLDLRFATEPVVAATPSQRVEDLIDLIGGYGLKKGTQNKLTHKLEKVLQDLERGQELRKVCDHLYKFSDEVTKESGKKMTTAQADALLAEAQVIRDQLGCPPHKKAKA